MGFGFPIILISLWLAGWVVWIRILKRRVPNIFFQFGAAFLGASAVWYVLVLYPVYDLRRSLSYNDVIQVIEEKTKIRFDPNGSIVGLGSGSNIQDGLKSCGVLCSNNYCIKGIDQKFIFFVNSKFENDKNGNRKHVAAKKYIQQFYGSCPNPNITTLEFDDNIIKVNSNLHIINYYYSYIYSIFGVEFFIKIYSDDNNLRRAEILMNKKGSWLEGMPDDASGNRDQELIMKFDWLDALRARVEGDDNA